MHAWESIQKVLDHIETNLSQQHSPESLAEVAALSPFYFQRLFTRLINRPVGEYIKMRRLARACEALADKSRRILDIALEYGFNSHESFTKVFKGAFGITPEAYRNHPVPLNQIIKPDLLLGYTLIDENVPLVTDGIVIEISRRILPFPEIYIGLSAQISAKAQTPVGEVTGINVPGMLWEEFSRQKHDIPYLTAGGVELGASIMDEMEQGKEDSFTYFVGAATDKNIPPTEPFKKYTLPAAEYVVCSVEAESFKQLTTSALGKSMNYLLNTWLPNHQLSSQPFSAEKYYKNIPGLHKMEIWLLPISIPHEQK